MSRASVAALNCSIEWFSNLDRRSRTDRALQSGCRPRACSERRAFERPGVEAEVINLMAKRLCAFTPPRSVRWPDPSHTGSHGQEDPTCARHTSPIAPEGLRQGVAAAAGGARQAPGVD